MNRVCLKKDGKLIEMQSGGDDHPDLMETRLNTLKQNALNAGYKEEDIEVKWVTDEELNIIMEAQRQRDLEARPYGEKRKPKYPPMADYLDGVVKGDQAQIDKYIADCLAVKAKYPKSYFNGKYEVII
jgi:hypothetical protein